MNNVLPPIPTWNKFDSNLNTNENELIPDISAIDINSLPPPPDFGSENNSGASTPHNGGSDQDTQTLEASAIKIQALWRGYQDRKSYIITLKSIVIIQKWFKGFKARKLYKKLYEETRWLRDAPPPISPSIEIIKKTRGAPGRKRPTRGVKVESKDIAIVAPITSEEGGENTGEEGSTPTPAPAGPKLVNMGGAMPAIPMFDPSQITLKSRPLLKENRHSIGSPEGLGKLRGSTGMMEDNKPSGGSEPTTSFPSPSGLRKTIVANASPTEQSPKLESKPFFSPQALRKSTFNPSTPPPAEEKPAFPSPMFLKKKSSSLSVFGSNDLPPPPSVDTLPPPIPFSNNDTMNLPLPMMDFPPPINNINLPPPPMMNDGEISLPPPPTSSNLPPPTGFKIPPSISQISAGISKSAGKLPITSTSSFTKPPSPPLPSVNSGQAPNRSKVTTPPFTLPPIDIPPPSVNSAVLPPPASFNSSSLPPPPAFCNNNNSNLPPPSNNFPPPFPVSKQAPPNNNNNLPPPFALPNIKSINNSLPPINLPPVNAPTKKLKPGWREFSTPEGKKYYHNKELDKTVWNESEAVEYNNVPIVNNHNNNNNIPPPVLNNNNTTTKKIKPGWREFSTPEGKKYYHNQQLNKTVWDEREAFEYTSPPISGLPPPILNNNSLPPPPINMSGGFLPPPPSTINMSNGTLPPPPAAFNNLPPPPPATMNMSNGNLPPPPAAFGNNNLPPPTTGLNNLPPPSLPPTVITTTSSKGTKIVWEEQFSKDGIKYYYHADSDTIRWEKPVDTVLVPEEKKRIGGVLSLFLKKRPSKQDLVEKKILEKDANAASSSSSSSKKDKKSSKKKIIIPYSFLYRKSSANRIV
ncbi:hypothetical protein CYY_005338 [Polysphondylium violaceum]|uniref:WW domain-containing protein n=1 Tax=Polysphondylium violaceum TaxID=133409 RepID=A0A8J4PUD5_9MYCE|nr:hypothetical protein CYY_005338 [Polysphondylium violaceum]